MKRPVCAVCDRPLQGEVEGREGLIEFADYRPLPQDVTGHPEGLEWFCERHYAAARELRHLTLVGVLDRLKRPPT